MKGTAIAALQVECGEMPLKLRRENQSIKYALKIKSIEDHPTNVILQENFLRIKEHQKSFIKSVQPEFEKLSRDLEPIKIQKLPPWDVQEIPVNTNLQKEIKKKENSEHHIRRTTNEHLNRQSTESIKLFTDGSKIGDRVGAAFYVENHDVWRAIRIPNGNTIYTAELIAIQQALNYIDTDISSRYIIFSDSLGVVRSIETGESRSRINLIDEIRTKIIELMKEGKEIEVHWLPSHVGVHGNEEADKLAKEALNHDTVDVPLRRDLHDVYTEVDEITMTRWQQQWDDGDKGRHYHRIEQRVSRKIKYSERLNRRKETMITRMRLGKCRLNFYLKTMNIHPSGKCDTCSGCDETIEHFLTECAEQQQLINKLTNICRTNSAKLEIQYILKNKHCIDEIFNYVKENEAKLKDRL